MQKTLIQAAFVILATSSIAATADAQGRGRNATGYPPGFRPPPGMCRVWIQGVPPGHQPGVTDCFTARASAPRNSRVIYGDRYDNPTFRSPLGIFSRTVYDGNGNRVVQRVQRNSNGTLSILNSLPYITRNYSTSPTYRSRPNNGKANKANKAWRGHGKHR
jgi:hypothetical protein